MNQFKTDARTDLHYELQGDYYVIAGEGDKRPTVGIWGQRHLRWLKQNRRITYTNLLTSGKLDDYLREIDAQASGQLDLMIRQMARAEGITEQLKAENPLEWVQRMNSIKNRAEEIVSDEFIYC
ncbi:MAG: TnpV protein [Oscillospiraceae bacterium]|nr:TnpV protein [Oscillospiraceae bacterium]